MLALLELVLHPDDREHVIGDLVEDYVAVAARHGEARARWHFRWQTLVALWSLGVLR